MASVEIFYFIQRPSSQRPPNRNISIFCFASLPYVLSGRDSRSFAGVQSEGAAASGGLSSIYPPNGCHHGSYEVDSLSVMSLVIMPIAMVCP